MNDTLILERLDFLASEIKELKTDIQQMKQERPEPSSSMHSDDLNRLVSEIHSSVEEMREARESVRAGIELTEDLQPVIRQVYPKMIRYFDELEGQFSVDELTALITRGLTSLGALNEALEMLKSGIELKDDLAPVAKLSYPKFQKFLSTLHEGEFQAEQLGTLLHTILLNIHTFSDLMNMISPMTEFVKEFEVAFRQTDFLSSVNKWLDSLQQSNGMIKVVGLSLAAIKRINLTDEQFDQICHSLSSINLSQVEPVGPMGMIRQLKDPEFQKAMGATFMIMQAIGGCVNACSSEDAKAQNTK